MNIAEIAKMAGVSSAAVSRYFNNGYISEEKREQIRKVVEETGYRPSVQAQTLRTKKTKMLGVIVPRIASVSIGRIVEGILSVLNKSGYEMMLAVTENNPKKELEYLQAFNGKQVDGVILVATVFTPEHKRILKALKVPVVIVGQKLPGHHCVYHDDYQATHELTQYYFEQGRKNIGFIGVFRQDKAAGSERYRGFCDAVAEHGQESMADNSVVAEFSAESGYAKAAELLKKCPDLDTIICASDTIAVGAMQYLREQGICMPDTIEVAGHGDSLTARVAVPPITTIHFAYEKSGETAVDMLLELLNHGNSAMTEVKLGCQIVENQVNRI